MGYKQIIITSQLQLRERTPGNSTDWFPFNVRPQNTSRPLAEPTYPREALSRAGEATSSRTSVISILLDVSRSWPFKSELHYPRVPPSPFPLCSLPRLSHSCHLLYLIPQGCLCLPPLLWMKPVAFSEYCWLLLPFPRLLLLYLPPAQELTAASLIPDVPFLSQTWAGS